MSVLRTVGELAMPAQEKTWTERLRAACSLSALCDWLVFAMLACWLGARLNLIVNHGLAGGGGDEGHRLVFSYRLYHDFSQYIYSYFFHNPWPPLPFIIQGAAFRIQQSLGFSADYGTAAVSTASCAYAFAVAMVYAAMSIRFQRLAGLLAAVLLLSMHDMSTLAATPMAESYCVFFLAFALLFCSFPKRSRLTAALIGLALMLAMLCRSEVIFLSVPFGIYCLYQHGRLAGAACLAIASFPFLLKAIVNRATGFSGMSYFNLADYYRFEGSFYANALQAFGALRNYAQAELAFGKLAGMMLLAAISGAIFYRALKARLVVKAPAFRSAYFWLLAGAAATLSACIVLAMAASFVLPFPRYFVICHFLGALPFAAAVSLPLARLGELFEERRTLGREFRSASWRWLGAAPALICAAGLAIGFYQGAQCFRATAVSLYKEQETHIPAPILAARQWLRKNCRQGRICYDSLLWWETFLFFDHLTHDSETPQFMVYDRPPGNWQEGIRPEAGEGNVAIMHRYIEVFRPEFIVLAGPEYRRALENIKTFADLNEKPSYLRPYLKECDGGVLEMTDAPYWDKSASLSVTLQPRFENETVAIYQAVYSAKP